MNERAGDAANGRSALRRLLRTNRAQRALFGSIAAIGVAIAAVGQALTTRHVPAALSWLAPFSGRIESIYGAASKSVAVGAVLLVTGSLLFVVGARHWGARRHAALTPPSSILRPAKLADFAAVAVFALGLGLFLVALRRLHGPNYHHSYAYLLLISLVAMAAPFVRLDLQRGLSFPRFSWWFLVEVAFLAVVVTGFILLNSHDLTSWRFSAWGDEYGQYATVRGIARGGSFNPFFQGMDGLLPLANTASMALVMKLLGSTDRFPWMFHDVLVAGLALICFYFLCRELFSVRVAVVATALLASSHYLFGYVHRPINIDAILPETAALWLLAVGLRRHSSLALYGAGLMAGVGFYTYFTGRITIVVIVIYMLTLGPKVLRRGSVAPLALGFVGLVAPLFAVNGHNVVDAMLSQSTISHAAGDTGPRVTRFLENIVRSLVGFNYNRDGYHYVWGSLLDPITAVFYALGIGIVLWSIRKPAYRFAAAWWGVGLATAGFTNPYDVTPISRLHYVLPAAVLLAALAVHHVLAILEDLWLHRPTRVAVSSAVFAAMIVPIFALNAYRFWNEEPRNFPQPAYAVATRAFLSKECRDQSSGTTFVSTQPGPLPALILDSYDNHGRNIMVLRYSDAFTVAAYLAGSPNVASSPPNEPPVAIVPFDANIPFMIQRSEEYDYLRDGCIVAVPDDDGFALFVSLMKARYPEKKETLIYDISGKSGGVALFY